MVSHFRGDSRAKKGHDLQQESRLAAPPCQPSRLRARMGARARRRLSEEVTRAGGGG